MFLRRRDESLALRFFSPEEVMRSRRYHRPLYRAAAAGFVTNAVVLTVLAWTRVGDLLDPESLPWWARTLAYAAIVVLVLAVTGTPLALWRGFLREQRWGFSTQRFSGWATDRAKAVAVEAILTALPLLGLVALARSLPGWWVVPAAAALALAVLLLSFLAPVVLEPLFNRYAPLQDVALAGQLRELADRAGVPVRDVLVQDMSRRTRKANAYVSGLGRTRRIVVADTLLELATPAEVRLVVAHELGHRRHRHVLIGTLLSMAGMAIATVTLWALQGQTIANPHRLPLVLLIGFALTLLSLPASTTVSRRWERTADRHALQLTGDRDAYERAFRRLARTNLPDLDPPRLLYLLLFTHPTPAERLDAAATASQQETPGETLLACQLDDYAR
jgi:STE24 endopeptidase